ncbi:MAG: dihydropteroate synthase [Bacteroidota bacterium]
MPLNRTRIMGILNLTPDSFSDGGLHNSMDSALRRVEQMLQEGADIIDIGGYSSRPYADPVSPEEELARIEAITARILDKFPEVIVSIDTFRPKVAERLLDIGAHIINDISAGSSLREQTERKMMELVSRYPDVPYIAMHMQGDPSTMQNRPQYAQVIQELSQFFVRIIGQAREYGIKDIVIDPGFGFGKTLLHNYQMIRDLEQLTILDVPILIGISRKSMLYKLLDTTPKDVLEAASALHLKCLEAGAHILRTHDVQAANKIVRLFTYMKENGIV